MQLMSKYVLYTSVALNGILLMAIAGPLPFLLYLSVVVNLIFVWFTRTCLQKLNDVEEDMVYIMNKNEIFLENLEQVHSLEMYYGDANLQNLIDHSRDLVNEYIEIQEKYFDVEVLDEEDEEETDFLEEGGENATPSP